MGHVVNPVSYRLFTIRLWNSSWFDLKNYSLILHKDLLIYQYIYKVFYNQEPYFFSHCLIKRIFGFLTLNIFVYDYRFIDIFDKKQRYLYYLKKRVIRNFIRKRFFYDKKFFNFNNRVVNSDLIKDFKKSYKLILNYYNILNNSTSLNFINYLNNSNNLELKKLYFNLYDQYNLLYSLKQNEEFLKLYLKKKKQIRKLVYYYYFVKTFYLKGLVDKKYFNKNFKFNNSMKNYIYKFNAINKTIKYMNILKSNNKSLKSKFKVKTKLNRTRLNRFLLNSELNLKNSAIIDFKKAIISNNINKDYLNKFFDFILRSKKNVSKKFCLELKFNILSKLKNRDNNNFYFNKNILLNQNKTIKKRTIKKLVLRNKQDRKFYRQDKKLLKQIKKNKKNFSLKFLSLRWSLVNSLNFVKKNKKRLLVNRLKSPYSLYVINQEKNLRKFFIRYLKKSHKDVGFKYKSRRNYGFRYWKFLKKKYSKDKYDLFIAKKIKNIKKIINKLNSKNNNNFKQLRKKKIKITGKSKLKKKSIRKKTLKLKKKNLLKVNSKKTYLNKKRRFSRKYIRKTRTNNGNLREFRRYINRYRLFGGFKYNLALNTDMLFFKYRFKNLKLKHKVQRLKIVSIRNLKNKSKRILKPHLGLNYFKNGNYLNKDLILGSPNLGSKLDYYNSLKYKFFNLILNKRILFKKNVNKSGKKRLKGNIKIKRGLLKFLNVNKNSKNINKHNILYLNTDSNIDLLTKNYRVNNLSLNKFISELKLNKIKRYNLNLELRKKNLYFKSKLKKNSLRKKKKVFRYYSKRRHYKKRNKYIYKVNRNFSKRNNRKKKYQKYDSLKYFLKSNSRRKYSKSFYRLRRVWYFYNTNNKTNKIFKNKKINKFLYGYNLNKLERNKLNLSRNFNFFKLKKIRSLRNNKFFFNKNRYKLNLLKRRNKKFIKINKSVKIKRTLIKSIYNTPKSHYFFHRLLLLKRFNLRKRIYSNYFNYNYKKYKYDNISKFNYLKKNKYLSNQFLNTITFDQKAFLNLRYWLQYTRSSSSLNRGKKSFKNYNKFFRLANVKRKQSKVFFNDKQYIYSLQLRLRYIRYMIIKKHKKKLNANKLKNLNLLKEISRKNLFFFISLIRESFYYSSNGLKILHKSYLYFLFLNLNRFIKIESQKIEFNLEKKNIKLFFSKTLNVKSIVLKMLRNYTIYFFMLFYRIFYLKNINNVNKIKFYYNNFKSFKFFNRFKKKELLVLSREISKMESNNVNINFYIIKDPTAAMFAKYIKKNLKRGSTLNQIIFPVLKSILFMYKNIVGIQINVSGRFTKKSRKSYLWYRRGRVQVGTSTVFIDYAKDFVILRFGLGGIKVWIYYKKLPKMVLQSSI